MLQRVMPELMGVKYVMALNDEAHHCYREKPPDPEDKALKNDDRKEAEKKNESARLWVSGLEAVNRTLGLTRVVDLSDHAVLPRGSGYAEGTLFPWTIGDFSLLPANEMPVCRKPVREHQQGHAEEGARRGWRPRSPETPQQAPDSARSLLGVPKEDSFGRGSSCTVARGIRDLSPDDLTRQVSAALFSVLDEQKDKEGHLKRVVTVESVQHIESVALVNRVLGREVGGKQNILVLNDEARTRR